MDKNQMDQLRKLREDIKKSVSGTVVLEGMKGKKRKQIYMDLNKMYFILQLGLQLDETSNDSETNDEENEEDE
jgi:hypothetical protein